MFDRFVDDDMLFQTWYDNRQAKALTEKCTEDCRKFHICGMWFPNYDEVEECVFNWDEHITSGSGFYSHVTALYLCPELAYTLISWVF